MTIRFCPTCRSNVKVEDGFCLLGHSIRLEPMTQSLTELRAEVDAAFDEVDHVFDEARRLIHAGAPQVEQTAPAAEVPAPAALAPTTFAGAPAVLTELAKETAAPTVAPAPAPVSESPPPGSRPSYADLWKRVEGEETGSKDPIASFAPAPRMDWGPSRGSRFRFSLRRNRTAEA